MNDMITVRGIVATAPKHILTSGGLSVASFRLATTARRYDRTTSSWSDGDTNWYTVTAFRALASNIEGSLSKGDRVVVLGRLRIRNWEREDRSGVAIEIDADTVGHDMVFGAATFNRIPRHIAEGVGTNVGPGIEELHGAAVDPATGEVIGSRGDRPDDDQDDGGDPDGGGDPDDGLDDDGVPEEPPSAGFLSDAAPPEGGAAWDSANDPRY